jgi:hypothetical protein
MSGESNEIICKIMACFKIELIPIRKCYIIVLKTNKQI